MIRGTKDSTKKNKKKAVASTILLHSPARDYDAPKLHSVATKIVVDESAFIPKYADSESSCVSLIANIAADHAGIRRVTLPHRATVTIDCGVSIELLPAYRAVIKSTPFLANKGLIVNEGLQIIDNANDGRVRITVTNVGKEIVVVNHGDQIAQMYIEPVYRFDWIME